MLKIAYHLVWAHYPILCQGPISEVLRSHQPASFHLLLYWTPWKPCSPHCPTSQWVLHGPKILAALQKQNTKPIHKQILRTSSHGIHLNLKSTMLLLLAWLLWTCWIWHWGHANEMTNRGEQRRCFLPGASTATWFSRRGAVQNYFCHKGSLKPSLTLVRLPSAPAQ